jgi:hypothetical protein
VTGAPGEVRRHQHTARGVRAKGPPTHSPSLQPELLREERAMATEIYGSGQERGGESCAHAQTSRRQPTVFHQSGGRLTDRTVWRGRGEGRARRSARMASGHDHFEAGCPSGSVGTEPLRMQAYRSCAGLGRLAPSDPMNNLYISLSMVTTRRTNRYTTRGARRLVEHRTDKSLRAAGTGPRRRSADARASVLTETPTGLDPEAFALLD